MDIFRSGQNIREACTADIGKGCRQNDLCQKTAVIGHHHLPLVLIIKIIHSAFHQMHLRSVVKVLDLHIFQRFQLPLSHTFCTVKRILWSYIENGFRLAKSCEFQMFSFDHLKIGDHLSLICIEKSYVERTMMQRRENFFHCTVPIPDFQIFLCSAFTVGTKKCCKPVTCGRNHTQHFLVFFHCCMNSGRIHQHIAGIFINLFTGLCHFHTTCFSFQKLHVQFCFQIFDGFTDMRLCGIQHLCCFLKTSALHTDHKILQLFQIHNSPTFPSFCYLEICAASRCQSSRKETPAAIHEAI